MSQKLDLPQIITVDLGSQYSLVIARAIRELGVRTAVLSPQKALEFFNIYKPKGIIWSGGAASVTDRNAPHPPMLFVGEVPLLGICYGMQYLAKHFGGKLTQSPASKEYGPRIAKFSPNALFQGVNESTVWCSHGDSVQILPPHFECIAFSETCPVLALASALSPVWGVQFHPEVTHTVEGKKILANFVFQICGCITDWYPEDEIKKIQGECLEKIPPDKNAIIGFSGGVDSSTLTAILKPVLKHRLTVCVLDFGNLRFDEMREIRANARSVGEPNPIIISEEKHLLEKLSNVLEPEEKRKIFKELYRGALEKVAKDYNAEYLFQGSLAPDNIESGAVGAAKIIKSHHNINLGSALHELHPFASLFKYEVREIARKLELPESIVTRHPFPGPGLIIRICWAPVTKESLDIVRQADAIVKDILLESGEYTQLSQLIVAICGGGNVAIKGDARKQGYLLTVKGVISHDFMTADAVQLNPETRKKITANITSQLSWVTRVAFDETPKPPATIEPQ